MKRIEEEYREVVSILEALAQDSMLREQRLEASIFFDDTLLRITLWAADIHLDRGSLDWADRILHISYRLRERLRRLKQCLDTIDTTVKSLHMGSYTEEEQFTALNDSVSEESDVTRGLKQAVDDLLDLATEIKTADLVPQSMRTSEETYRINESMTNPVQPVLSGRLPCLPFREPIPIDQASKLLGSINSLKDLVAADARSITWMMTHHKLNIQVEKKPLEKDGIDAVSELLVTSAELGVASDLKPKSKSRSNLERASIVEWEIIDPNEHLEYLLSHQPEDMMELHKRNRAAFVTTLLVTQMPVAQISTIDRRRGTASATFHPDRVELALAVRYMSVEAYSSMRPLDRSTRVSSAKHSNYIFAPNFDLPAPPNGPLQLGSVLTNWSQPGQPINTATDVVIPPMHIHRTLEHMRRVSFQKPSTGILGDLLETVWFSPTPQFLSDAMQLPMVKRHLKTSFLSSRSVYLVTGLKIARGAVTLFHRESSEQSTPISAVASMDAPGITVGAKSPATAGAEPSATDTAAKESRGADGSTDFVAAYSLIECKMKRGRSTPSTSTFIHRDRAFF